jgi:hypothetical protein
VENFLHRVFEGNAFRIISREPSVGGVGRGEHLEMVDVANVLAGVDINPDCHRFLMLGFEGGRDLKETPSRMESFFIDAAGRPMSLAASRGRSSSARFR